MRQSSLDYQTQCVSIFMLDMSERTANLTTAANGHLQLCFERASPLFALWLRLKLQFVHGFRREGHRVRGLNEVIVPNFVRGNIRLLAGWDNWSGYYLLSESVSGDDFLSVYAKDYV
ncbi:MAG: hypothetical protein PHI11_07390 [Gallionella sp.]|nr:hypothetical protein [Gallionella sp.]